MKLHRFIIDNEKLQPGILKIEDGELSGQIRKVLKLRIGEKIILANGRGTEAEAEIKKYGDDSVTILIENVSRNFNEPVREVILFCAVLKKENFEFVVQKTTEVGIRKIVPIITERTVKLNIKEDRLEKIIKEAAEQSGRGIVPVLSVPVGFEEAAEGVRGHTGLLFDLSGESPGVLERHDIEAPISIFIGPEGGWTEKELTMARSLGFKIINLGKLTLRAETAAILGSYLTIHNF